MSRLDDCDRIRPLLADLVDATPADVAPATRDAVRAHVAWCQACESALAELVLTGYAVRRTLAPAASIEPPADAWPRLRARVTRRSPGLGFAGSSLAGLLVGAAVAVMLVVPFTVPKPTPKVNQEIGIEVIVTSGAVPPKVAVAAPAAPSPEPASSAHDHRPATHGLAPNVQPRDDAAPAAVVASTRDLRLPFRELSDSVPAARATSLPRIQAQ